MGLPCPEDVGGEAEREVELHPERPRRGVRLVPHGAIPQRALRSFPMPSVGGDCGAEQQHHRQRQARYRRAANHLHVAHKPARASTRPYPCVYPDPSTLTRRVPKATKATTTTPFQVEIPSRLSHVYSFTVCAAAQIRRPRVPGPVPALYADGLALGAYVPNALVALSRSPIVSPSPKTGRGYGSPCPITPPPPKRGTFGHVEVISRVYDSRNGSDLNGRNGDAPSFLWR